MKPFQWLFIKYIPAYTIFSTNVGNLSPSLLIWIFIYIKNPFNFALFPANLLINSILTGWWLYTSILVLNAFWFSINYCSVTLIQALSVLLLKFTSSMLVSLISANLLAVTVVGAVLSDILLTSFDQSNTYHNQVMIV